jgi:triphosphatase
MTDRAAKSGRTAAGPPPAGRGPADGETAAAPGREVELKLSLRAEDVAPLRRRLDRLARPRRERIDNIYFDTPDHRLAAARAALRLRAIGQGRGRRWVQTFKTDEGDDALSVRGEWETPAPGGRIDLARLADSPLALALRRPGDGSRTRGARAPARLRPVFRTAFERTTWDLEVPGARIEAVIDIGEIQAGGRHEPICEAEFELRSGPPGALLELALKLAGAVGRGHADLRLLPYGASKAARGYRLARGGETPPATAGRIAPEASTFTTAQRTVPAARRWVAAGTGRLLANADGARTSHDPEFVHQARVCLRQLAVGIDVLLKETDFPAGLRRDLQVWTRRLGSVRDWDVLCGRLLPGLAAQERSGASAWDAVRAAAARRQEAARARLRRQLDAPAFAEFALRMLRWSASGADRVDPGKRLGDFAHRELRARRRRLLRKLDKSGRPFARLSLERQHKIRKQAKSLRYAMEMLRAVLPKDLRRLALPGLARFQEVAGLARDLALAQDMIERLTRSDALRESLRDWVRAEQRRALKRSERLVAGFADDRPS